MRGSSFRIIPCLLMSVVFSLLTPTPSERGRRMMFCLLYGIGSIDAKKRLEREIPEGRDTVRKGPEKALPSATPEGMRKSSYYIYNLLKNMREGFNQRARVTGRQIRPLRVFACRETSFGGGCEGISFYAFSLESPSQALKDG